MCATAKSPTACRGFIQKKSSESVTIFCKTFFVFLNRAQYLVKKSSYMCVCVHVIDIPGGNSMKKHHAYRKFSRFAKCIYESIEKAVYVQYFAEAIAIVHPVSPSITIPAGLMRARVYVSLIWGTVAQYAHLLRTSEGNPWSQKCSWMLCKYYCFWFGSWGNSIGSRKIRYSPFQYLNYIWYKFIGFFIKWKSKVSKDTEDTALHVSVS